MNPIFDGTILTEFCPNNECSNSTNCFQKPKLGLIYKIQTIKLLFCKK